MAVAELPGIVEQLVRNGRAPESPAAIIGQGTRPDQRTIVTTLGELPAAARTCVRQPSWWSARQCDCVSSSTGSTDLRVKILDSLSMELCTSTVKGP